MSDNFLPFPDCMVHLRSAADLDVTSTIKAHRFKLAQLPYFCAFFKNTEPDELIKERAPSEPNDGSLRCNYYGVYSLESPFTIGVVRFMIDRLYDQYDWTRLGDLDAGEVLQACNFYGADVKMYIRKILSDLLDSSVPVDSLRMYSFLKGLAKSDVSNTMKTNIVLRTINYLTESQKAKLTRAFGDDFVLPDNPFLVHSKAIDDVKVVVTGTAIRPLSYKRQGTVQWKDLVFESYYTTSLDMHDDLGFWITCKPEGEIFHTRDDDSEETIETGEIVVPTRQARLSLTVYDPIEGPTTFKPSNLRSYNYKDTKDEFTFPCKIKRTYRTYTRDRYGGADEFINRNLLAYQFIVEFIHESSE